MSTPSRAPSVDDWDARSLTDDSACFPGQVRDSVQSVTSVLTDMITHSGLLEEADKQASFEGERHYSKDDLITALQHSIQPGIEALLQNNQAKYEALDCKTSLWTAREYFDDLISGQYNPQYHWDDSKSSVETFDLRAMYDCLIEVTRGSFSGHRLYTVTVLAHYCQEKTAQNERLQTKLTKVTREKEILRLSLANATSGLESLQRLADEGSASTPGQCH